MSIVADKILVNRPLTLDDIYGQEIPVRILKHYLENDRIPGGGLLAHGEAGCGKTTAIAAFIRTVLCLNRALGETRPCLTCLSCQQLENPQDSAHPNVKWVQVGRGASNGEESLNNQVNEALEATKTGPYYSAQPHQNYKFIVVDEVQNLPVNLLQRFLYFPEAVKQQRIHNVRLIFSTMNLHRINADTKASLQGRMVQLPFRTPTYDELWLVGRRVCPDVPDHVLGEICEQIEQYGGGYRQLINYLDVLWDVFRFDLQAACQYLGHLNRHQIDYFWRLCARCAVEKKAYEDSFEYFMHMLRLCNGEVHVLYGQLLNSLIWIMSKPESTPEHYTAMRALAHGILEKRSPPTWVLPLCQNLPYVPLVNNDA